MAHQTFFKSDLPTRVDRRLARQRDDDAIWRSVCKVIDARDGRTCRACGKRTNPDDVGLLRGHRHHLIYRSAGGADVKENLVTLCASCHDAEHVKRTLEIVCVSQSDGAEGLLEFWRKDDDDDQFYLSKRELAIGHFEKD